MVTVFGVFTSPRIRGTLLSGRVAVKLIRIVGDWAREQGATELHIHSTSGVHIVVDTEEQHATYLPAKTQRRSL